MPNGNLASRMIFLRNSFVGSRANVAIHALGIIVRAPCPEPLRLHCHYEKQTREEFPMCDSDSCRLLRFSEHQLNAAIMHGSLVHCVHCVVPC